MSEEEDRIAELRRFLKERRARLRPDDVGIAKVGRRRVRGLRREEVASLAGIGVSWYTALESGEARGVSEATLRAVAEALRLSDSERQYLTALAAPARANDAFEDPGPLVVASLEALWFPAYIITATWDVVKCNAAFCRVWAVDASELPFNAVARMFMAPAAREMHGDRFADNVRPVVAMLHSSLGRQPGAKALRELRDQFVRDPDVRTIWNDYEISSPLLPNACTIECSIGTFHYETLTLPIPNTSHGIVVQVPDDASRARLAASRSGD